MRSPHRFRFILPGLLLAYLAVAGCSHAPRLHGYPDVYETIVLDGKQYACYDDDDGTWLCYEVATVERELQERIVADAGSAPRPQPQQPTP
ncbi:MAG: hypothetical protein R6X25_11645 [Candidatus Krumholzibacteriia bacterium]